MVNDSGHTDEFLIAFVYMAFLFPIAFVIDDFMAPTPELLQIIGKCTYHLAGFITVQRINAANILSLVGIPETQNILNCGIGQVIVRIHIDGKLGGNQSVGSIVACVHAAVFLVNIADLKIIVIGFPALNQLICAIR